MTTKPEVFAARRQRLIEQIRNQQGGIAVLFSGEEVMRNRDADYPFRWDSYFYYLTGFTEPEAALVIDAGAGRSTLYCREKNAERETWDGFRWGPEAACREFGLDAALPIGELDGSISEMMHNQPALYYPLGSSEQIDQRVRGWLNTVRAQARAGITVPATASDIHSLLDEMRLVKDASELATMRKAASISAEAHCRAMRSCQPGQFEYEVEAELLHEFRKNGSQFPAYGSIVASGANACVLHYRANDRKMKDGDLLLIDAGCELDSYASDITRTFPVGGKFTTGQQELYEIVLQAQLAAIDATRSGNTFNDPHDAALKILVQGMIDTQLLSGGLDEAIESGSYRRFYMHRTSHWLGMDVHDCGDYRERSGGLQDNGTPPWRSLVPGMVLTIEPGIYVNASDDVPERFHDVGIRIEDDVVVTGDTPEVITSDVPKSIRDVETMTSG